MIVKVCPCCAVSITRAEWERLPLCGRADGLELRNHHCGSTIAIERSVCAACRRPIEGVKVVVELDTTDGVESRVYCEACAREQMPPAEPPGWLRRRVGQSVGMY